jgi:surfactin synthase thioesterase subunit
MNKTIYCISGLGADERLFKYLDLPGYTLQVLQWPEHRPVDNLVSYAYKMSEQIQEPNPILLGVSFGGMLAIEIAKKLKASQTFLISSVQSAKDLPFYYRWAGSLSLTSLIPDVLINEPSEIQEHLFGVEGEEDKALLRHYLINADPPYIRWGLRVILEWENDEYPLHVVHIHGTSDRVIPIPKGVHYRVQEGGHMMVFNKAEEVSKLVAENLYKNM